MTLREEIRKYCEECPTFRNCILAREDEMVIAAQCSFAKKKFEGRRF
jgi:hypothetical protein